MRNEVRVRAGQCEYVVPRVHGTDHGRWGFGDRCAALLGTHQDAQLVNMQLPSPMCALLVWKLIMTAETKPLFLLRCQKCNKED